MWWNSPRRRGLAGLVLSALLLGIFARGGLAWVVGFVALVPWLLAIDSRRHAQEPPPGAQHDAHAGEHRGAQPGVHQGVRRWLGALASGWLMSVGFVAAVFLWFGAAIGAYTGVGAGVGTAVLLILAPVMQPQLLAFALVRHGVGRRHGPVLRALAGAATWVGVEWLVPKLLGDTLGHGLFPSATLRQAADLGGAAGLTVLLLLVNEAIAHAIARGRERGPDLTLGRALAFPLGTAAAVVLAMAGYGQWRLSTLAPPGPEVPRLKVAMIQASITNYEQLRQEIGAYGVVRKVLDTHYELSWSALRDHGADVLLWSETVYPTTFAHPRSEDGAALDREIQGFVDAAGVPLVFGTYDLDDAGEYNATAFLEPGRGLLGFYRKAHPFPLTEYVPAWLDTPWLRRLLPWTGTWRPGDGARVMPLRTRDGREVNVLPLICLDDTRGRLAIDGARLGAQAIVGMSNDSWFTDYPAGARLHLSIAAFRSVETRLPQVRVTTNGLSAVIDDTGEVLVQTAMGDQAVLTAELAAQEPPLTVVVRWGDWVGRVAWVFLGVLGFLALAARLSKRDHAAPAALPARVQLLSPAVRVAMALLRLTAALGLAWLVLDMWLRMGFQVQSIKQLQGFGYGVALPLLAAWALGRMSLATASIEGNDLVLDQRRQRTAIPLASVRGLRTWRLPWPHSGADLMLASGKRWSKGLAVADPAALARTLAAAGAPLTTSDDFSTRLATARAATGRGWLDYALVKFVLFPLLPALVAFRLHQVITFGGFFGEAYTFGFGAWLLGLLVWWASWALGLMLFAAVLRVLVEGITGLSLVFGVVRAVKMRRMLGLAAHLAYFVGVPAWLVMRLLAV